MLPWESTTWTFSGVSLHGGGNQVYDAANLLVLQLAFRLERQQHGSRSGFFFFGEQFGFGWTIWTRASSTSAMLRIVRWSSPSCARRKFTFWVKSVIPNLVWSNSSNPTPPPRASPGPRGSSGHHRASRRKPNRHSVAVFGQFVLDVLLAQLGDHFGSVFLSEVGEKDVIPRPGRPENEDQEDGQDDRGHRNEKNPLYAFRRAQISLICEPTAEGTCSRTRHPRCGFDAAQHYLDRHPHNLLV